MVRRTVLFVRDADNDSRIADCGSFLAEKADYRDVSGAARQRRTLIGDQGSPSAVFPDPHAPRLITEWVLNEHRDNRGHFLFQDVLALGMRLRWLALANDSRWLSEDTRIAP